jgi:hypothetical protein
MEKSTEDTSDGAIIDDGVLSIQPQIGLSVPVMDAPVTGARRFILPLFHSSAAKSEKRRRRSSAIDAAQSKVGWLPFVTN